MVKKTDAWANRYNFYSELSFKERIQKVMIMVCNDLFQKSPYHLVPFVTDYATHHTRDIAVFVTLEVAKDFSGEKQDRYTLWKIENTGSPIRLFCGSYVIDELTFKGNSLFINLYDDSPEKLQNIWCAYICYPTQIEFTF